MPDRELVVPLVEVGVPEEAEPGTVGAAMPLGNLPKIANYADDEGVKKQINSDVVPILTWCRINRQALDEEWRAIRRMEHLRHDEGQKYRGRSNAYLPVYSRNLQTISSNLSRGLFPSDEYMDVVDRGGFGPDGRPPDPSLAKATKTYLQWEFESVANVPSAVKPFLRQFTNYGNSVMKVRYQKELRNTGKLAMKQDLAKLMRGEYGFSPEKIHDGLAVSTRSMYYWYLYPYTAETIEDATLIFEDVDVPRLYIQDMLRKRRWINGDDALNAPIPPTHSQSQADQYSEAFSMTPPQVSPLQGTELGDVRTITEVWTFLKLPSSAYVNGEDTGEPIPARIVMAGTVPLEVTRNPFGHQRPPYLVARSNVHPGLFYGTGFGRLVRSLQYLANDFANQTNDVGIYGLNPIIKRNPGFIVGPMRPLAPGVVWDMTDEKGVVFDRPPVEQVQYGLMMLNTTVQMIQDYGGAPPAFQGIGSKGAGKTATGMQILQHNVGVPLQDIVEDIERDVMVPLMYHAWMNAQQYRDEAVMTMVAGQSLKVSPEMLAIDPMFRWLASSQAVNQQQRAQQAMAYLQSAMPYIPLLNQLGYVFDPVPLLRRIYSDGLGFREFDTVIKPAQAMMAQSAGSPLNVGGVAAEQGDRLRSATEQANLGQSEMVPGEGGEFANVRDNADELAGLFGGAQ